MTQRNAIISIGCNGNAAAVAIQYTPDIEPGEPKDLAQILTDVALEAMNAKVNELRAEQEAQAQAVEATQ